MDAFFGREFHTMSALSRGIARLSKRRKKQRDLPAIIEHDQNTTTPDLIPHHLEVPNTAKPSLLGRSMDRLRRSIRQSFKRNRSQESQPPALVASILPDGRSEAWQPDEAAVRAGVCKFHVKYLGATEVFESRGMPICENALKHLRSLKRQPVKAILHVSGDGLRVVDQENSRGLMVDQTIEKVSFCAPDRNNDKGFAYICRDGTTRRWMCHGFHASKDSGERLSHAVGCAFAICLEKKKKRDEDNMFASDKPVTVEKALNPDWGDKNGEAATNGVVNPMQRTNNAYQSFRKQISMSDRLQDPQSAIVNELPSSSVPQNGPSIAKPRPVANPALFQRQGSLRAPESSQNTNFRRNCSLRTNVGMAIPERPPHMSLGTIMCKEPIYEGDEDYLVGLPPTNTSAPVTSREVAAPSAQFTDPFGQGFNHAAPVQQPTNNGAPQQQSSSVDDLLDFNGSKTSPTTTWADDWLNSALKTSVSSPMTSSSMSVTSNPYSTNPSVVESPRSGPPPTSAPPPIPQRPPGISSTIKAKQTTYTNDISPSINTSMDTFGQSINWEVTSPRHVPKPEDPFDIQWSKMAISSNNPFATEQPRVISN